MPDQFDLLGPADGFHRSADRAGGYACRLRQHCQLGITGAVDRGRRGCRLCSPCKESLPLICPGGQPSGTASWGFNSVFMVIWAGLQSRGGGAENAGQQRKAVTALS